MFEILFENRKRKVFEILYEKQKEKSVRNFIMNIKRKEFEILEHHIFLQLTSEDMLSLISGWVPI